jgi:hypothetical protein
MSSGKRRNRVRRERAWSIVKPSRELVRSPGNNQSSGGGNETAEASNAEGRVGDSASRQAVT